MDNGTIKEEGTYERLMKEGVVFSRLMADYGNLDEEEQAVVKGGKAAIVADKKEEVDLKKKQVALMQTEERMTGAVSFETYGKYFNFAGGFIWIPVLFLLLTLGQLAQGD